MTKAPDKLVVGQRIHLNAKASAETINIDLETPISAEQIEQLEKALSTSLLPLNIWNCSAIGFELGALGIEAASISLSPEPLKYSLEMISTHPHPIPVRENEHEVNEEFETVARNWILFARNIFTEMQDSGAHLLSLKKSDRKESRATLLTKCEMVTSTVFNMAPSMSRVIAKLAMRIKEPVDLERAVARLKLHIDEEGGMITMASVRK